MNVFDPDAMPGWLQHFLTDRQPDLIAGPAEDDCAVLDMGDSCLVATTDYFNSRPIVLELGLGGLAEIGRLLVAANLSDLLGSGANPRMLLASLMLPRDADTADFKELMRGISEQCAEAGVSVGGGDTKLGESLVICATAIGTAPSREHLFLQANARPGDKIWCSGKIGGVGAALHCFAEEKGPVGWREDAQYRIVNPRLPYEPSRLLAETLFRKAGTDLSDGIAGDLNGLMNASKVGVLLRPEQIPVDDFVLRVADHFNNPPWAYCFSTGGDFQFVCTAPSEQDLGAFGFTEIGEVTNETGRLKVEVGGRHFPLRPIGHRDANNMTFRQEAKANVEELLQTVGG